MTIPRLRALSVVSLPATLLLACGVDVAPSAEAVDPTAPAIPVGPPHGEIAVAGESANGSPRGVADSLGCETPDKQERLRRVEAAGVKDLTLRWPGPIPYYLETSGDAALVPLEVTNFHIAVANIEMRTPIRFLELSTADYNALPGSADVIHVINEPTWCHGNSDVGHQGGTQTLRLGSGCANASQGGMNVGVITHELGHAVGLHHEQQRPDRDMFVTVCAGNSSSGSQYSIQNGVDLLTPYDFHSIMHYGQNGFLASSPDPTQCAGHVMVLANPQTNTFPYAPAACTSCPTAGVNGCEVDCHHIGEGAYLTAEDINGLTLMYGTPLGLPENNGLYGAALAVADFDQDGYDDVMAGAPGANLTGGAVFAYKGTLRGIAPWKVLSNKPVQGDDFGQTLAVGDFNGDGYPDLAVGAPRRALAGGAALSGTVTLYYGGAFVGARRTPDCGSNSICQGGGFPGITARFALSPQDASGVANEDGDLFGSALAVADFDGDGFQDLAVGAPGKAGGAGRVFVYSGKALEVSSFPAVMLGAFAKGGFGSFGSALAAGDFNGDKVPDLAVGAPAKGQEHVTVFQAASVTNFLERVSITPPPGVLPGDGFGSTLLAARLTGKTRPAFLVVSAPQVRLGSGEVDIDAFTPFFAPTLVQRQVAGTYRGGYGSALATLDLDSDGFDDLVVGAPAFAQPQEGIVELLRSTGGHVTHWDQILAPAGASPAHFGGSFAVGQVRGDPVVVLSPPSGIVYDPARLLIGAPITQGTYPFVLPDAGQFHEFVVKPGTILEREGGGEEMQSPFAL
jgi:hypothetical protein